MPVLNNIKRAAYDQQDTQGAARSTNPVQTDHAALPTLISSHSCCLRSGFMPQNSLYSIFNDQ